MKMREMEEMMLRGRRARVATVDLSSAGASSLRDGVILSLVKDVFWKLKWWNNEKKTPSDGSHAWEVEAQWELREAEGEEGEAGDDVAQEEVVDLARMMEDKKVERKKTRVERRRVHLGEKQ